MTDKSQPQLPMQAQKDEALSQFLQDEGPKLLANGVRREDLAYIYIRRRRDTTYAELQRYELKSQEVLSHLEGANIVKLEAALKAYNDIYNEMKKARMPFTNFIRDSIIKKSMAFEERVNPETNPKYLSLEKYLIKLKLKRDEEVRLVTAKALERNQLIAHIKNENTLRLAEYERRCHEIINKAYENALERMEAHPDVEAIKEEILKVELKPMGEFKLQHHTPEEGKDIVRALHDDMPDRANIRIMMFNAVENKFFLYNEELNTVKAQPEHLMVIHDEGVKEVEDITQTAKTLVAVETMSINAKELPISRPSDDGKPIKYGVEIVNENSFEWAMRVIAAFQRAPVAVKEFIPARKNWDGFSVGSMKSALESLAKATNLRDKDLQYAQTIE